MTRSDLPEKSFSPWLVSIVVLNRRSRMVPSTPGYRADSIRACTIFPRVKRVAVVDVDEVVGVLLELCLA